MMKALILLSGGLDSTLAAKVILEQNIELEALNFITAFCTCTHKGETCMASRKAIESLHIPLTVFNVSEEYLTIIKNPKHGYGRNMNPCLDCRILMLKKAKSYMLESGAAFVVTGEVLGQRPMSQRKQAMLLIEKEVGLERLIVRPLSARNLAPTLPEENGWIDRGMLLSIQGRSRKEQMRLADFWGIHDYPCPAGGCLLTDPQFAKRIKDLLLYDPDFSLNDVHLLKVGRHFRFSPAAKLVVGRNETDNMKIRTFCREEDILLNAGDRPGPLSLLRGQVNDLEIQKAASITARYAKPSDSKETKILCTRGAEKNAFREVWVWPAAEEESSRLMV